MLHHSTISIYDSAHNANTQSIDFVQLLTLAPAGYSLTMAAYIKG